MITLADHIVALNGRTVMVISADGIPVSIGRVTVNSIDSDSRASPVTITFETHAIRCELGVPASKIDALSQSRAGEHLAYRLPPGNAFNFSVRPPSQHAVTEPVIETFPLPERGPAQSTAPAPLAAKSPTAVAAEKLKKTSAAVDRLIRDVAPLNSSSRRV